MANKAVRSRSILAAAAYIGLATLGAPHAQAHHEVGVYDTTHPIVVMGVVTSFLWANPHAWLYLRATAPSNGDWALESASVVALEHRGWNRRSLSAGEPVTVLVAPRRDGQAGGLIMQVTLTNGEVLH